MLDRAFSCYNENTNRERPHKSAPLAEPFKTAATLGQITGTTIFGVDRQLAYQLLFLYHFYI
ncbi:hypothetical protein EFP22_08250 [Lacticaseibacillus paracasei]|nr:hypothetical protein [Lacticaseibacillus paracasei]